MRVLCGRWKWLLRARFNDYVVAAGTAASSLPVVGKHLEPLSGIAAMGLWGVHYIPDALRLTPLRPQRREPSSSLMAAGLADIVAAEHLAEPWPPGQPGAPWRHASRHRRLVHSSSVPYGDEPGQVLDVWRREDLAAGAPVLMFVPGGAWVMGSRLIQGHALMARLAELGWVCLSVQYRTSPRNRWPRQLTDVHDALAWARTTVADFGGDPSFLAVAGCSAGGHMASLAGLAADSGAAAVVSIYGRYDWEDRSTPERARFMDFLERVVVQRKQSRHPDVFRDASPMAQLRAEAPPFLVVHGTHDALIPVAEARRFAQALRAVSANPVGYVELPGAGHGFDLLDAERTAATVRAAELFLTQVYRTHRDGDRLAAMPS